MNAIYLPVRSSLATADRSQFAVEGKSIIVSYAQFLHRLTRLQSPFYKFIRFEILFKCQIWANMHLGKKRRTNLYNYNRFHR